MGERQPRSYDPRDGYNCRIQDWLLAGYVIFLPVQIAVSPSLRLAPSDGFLALALLGFTLRVGRLQVVRSAWSFWHFGLVASCLLYTLVALTRTGYVTREALLNKDVGLLVLFAAYAVITGQTNSWPRIRRVLRLLIVTVAVQNVVCLVAFAALTIVGVSLPGMDFRGARLTGLLLDPNAYGGLLVLVLSIHMVASCGKRPLVPGIAGGLVTLTLAIGTLLTYSRSAWTGLALVFVLTMLLRPKTGVRLAIVSALAIVGVLQVFGPNYLSQMSHLALRQSQVDARVQLINQALDMFSRSPAFGVGLGVFNDNVGQIIHNTPIWILTESGALGLIFLTGFALWFVRTGVRAFRLASAEQKPLALGLLTANIAMMGLSMGIEALYQRHWWLVLALIVSAHSAARTDVSARRRVLAERIAQNLGVDSDESGICA
jgi:putative inorganic carbon (hco3(-)) transporter